MVCETVAWCNLSCVAFHWHRNKVLTDRRKNPTICEWSAVNRTRIFVSNSASSVEICTNMISVHLPVLCISYMIVSTTVFLKAAEFQREKLYITAQHLKPTGPDKWNSRVASSISCARACTQQADCVQFQWNDETCQLNRGGNPIH